MANNRFRLRFTFWLDMLKSDEHELADQIEVLKQERSFVSTVRDGIRLVTSLREGKLDVLFELFPWVQAEFLKYLESIQPQKAEPELQLQQQLERLERLMLERGYVPEQGARQLPPRPELPRPLEPLPPAEYDENACETLLGKFL